MMHTIDLAMLIYMFSYCFGMGYMDTIGHPRETEYLELEKRTRTMLLIPGINMLICAWMILCTILYYIQRLETQSNEKIDNDPTAPGEQPDSERPV